MATPMHRCGAQRTRLDSGSLLRAHGQAQEGARRVRLLFAGDRYPPIAPAPAAGLVADPARLGLPITIQVAADGHGRSELRSADSEDDSFSHGVTSGGE